MLNISGFQLGLFQSIYSTGKRGLELGGRCSVAQSYPTLWDPTDCGTLGSSAFHYPQSLLKLMSFESVVLLTILSSAAHFSFCLQPFQASGSFPVKCRKALTMTELHFNQNNLRLGQGDLSLCRQPLRWLPVKPTSWPSCPWVILWVWAGLSDCIPTNRTSKMWWVITSEIKLQRSSPFALHCLSASLSCSEDSQIPSCELIYRGGLYGKELIAPASSQWKHEAS